MNIYAIAGKIMEEIDDEFSEENFGALDDEIMRERLIHYIVDISRYIFEQSTTPVEEEKQ